MRRFTPGFVVRNGGLLLLVEVGVEVCGSLDTSPEMGGGGGGVGASSPAISAIARVTGRQAQAGVVWFRGRSGTGWDGPAKRAALLPCGPGPLLAA